MTASAAIPCALTLGEEGKMKCHLALGAIAMALISCVSEYADPTQQQDVLLRISWNPGMTAVPNDRQRQTVFVLTENCIVYFRKIDSEGNPEFGALSKGILEKKRAREILEFAGRLSTDGVCPEVTIGAPEFLLTLHGSRSTPVQYNLCPEFQDFAETYINQCAQQVAAGNDR